MSDTAASHSARTAPVEVSVVCASLQEWLEHWLCAIAARRVRARTLSSYESLLRRHVYPVIGHVVLGELTPEHVEQMLAAMAAHALSPATQNRAFRVLSRALKVAVQRGRVSRNVASLVDPPAVRAVRPATPLSAEEARAVLEAAAPQRQAVRWTLALALGLRQSEALGLRWSDLDLDAGTLRVERGLHRVAGRGLVYEPPKSTRGRRAIVLPEPVIAQLREHFIRQKRDREAAGAEWEEHGLVIAQCNGRPVDRRGDHRAWSKLLAEAGVRHVRLHDARHTTATLLLSQGVQARVVSELMGHSQTKITIDTYTHVLPGLAREAAEQLTVALFPMECTDASGAR